MAAPGSRTTSPIWIPVAPIARETARRWDTPSKARTGSTSASWVWPIERLLEQAFDLPRLEVDVDRHERGFGWQARHRRELSRQRVQESRAGAGADIADEKPPALGCAHPAAVVGEGEVGLRHIERQGVIDEVGVEFH